MMTTAEQDNLKPAVAISISEIRSQFSDSEVTVRADGEGGAYVIVESVPLSSAYVQTDTWIGFRITFQYPDADVYPHFVCSDLLRSDGRPLGEGTGNGNFEGRNAVQLSRRSNQLNSATDTALYKLLKVLDWLNKHQ